jgi:chromosome transmission fidelity protein 1
MGEIRKTAFSTARTIPLSSRANLCINDDVKRASKGVEDLNERCLDLQKKGVLKSVMRALTLEI